MKLKNSYLNEFWIIDALVWVKRKLRRFVVDPNDARDASGVPSQVVTAAF